MLKFRQSSDPTIRNLTLYERVVNHKWKNEPKLLPLLWYARIKRELRYTYRDLMALSMYAGSKASYTIQVTGRENFTATKSTIIAYGHKRDEDIPIIIPRLYQLQGRQRRKAMRLLYEATRDDFCEDGFLLFYFSFLKILRPVIARWNVSWWLHIVQACPVKLPDEQSVSQLLNETRRLEGNDKLIDSVVREWRVKLVGEDRADDPKLTLMQTILTAPLDVLRQYATPRMFSEPRASRIRERQHATLVKQLYYITRIIDKGGTLFIAPEGKVSPDGRFGKMRAAMTRFVQQTRTDVRMLPVNATYDFMDTQRAKVLVNVGPEILSLKRLSKTQLADLVGQAIPNLNALMMSGLASRRLLELAESGQSRIRLFDLRDQLWEEFWEYKRAGLTCDDRLETRQGFIERLERFIGYCKKRNDIFVPVTTGPSADSSDEPLHSGDEWLELNIPALLRPDCQKPNDHPVRYCYNELMALLTARGLLTPTQEEDSQATLIPTAHAG